jgi:hypothetical protein
MRKRVSVDAHSVFGLKFNPFAKEIATQDLFLSQDLNA